MLIAGIDEAGRGACLGPLVLGIVVMEKKDEERLLEFGVKDSKLLTPGQRDELLPKVQSIAKEHNFAAIFPEELDLLMDRKSLNEIEAMRAGALLNSLSVKPDVVFVDAPDVIEESFARRMRKYISFPIDIRSEHKADLNYPVVSAASIIAKVQRDLEIEKLKKEFGEIGCGYSHDAKTIAFIEAFLQEHKKLPPIARKSWGTSQRLLAARFQQKLF